MIPGAAHHDLPITVSQPRRVLGVGMLGTLGALLLYIAFVAPPEPGWLIFLLALGFLSLVGAVRMWQATARALVLTQDGLYEQGGRQIAAMADITRINRGAFAIKPSNGFTLEMATPGPRAWVPGVWWRLGRRVAVGGVLNAREAKMASDMLSARLAMQGPPR